MAGLSKVAPVARRQAALPFGGGRVASPMSPVSDGAVVERLARMRGACQALALELAGTKRELRTVEAELRRLKQRHGES